MDFDRLQTSSHEAMSFCRRFLESPSKQRWLFGVNEYATMLQEAFDIAGFIDDFHPEREVNGLPVIGLDEAPGDARVISTLLGRPLTGRKLLSERQIDHLDFFGFYEHCGLSLPEVRFWGNQREDFQQHREHYEWLGAKLTEDSSRKVFEKLMGLRLSGDLSHHEGFSDRQTEQYFEDFLDFTPGAEVFVDIGAFDGATSLEFTRRCPGYRSIYAFEPERRNADRLRETLGAYDRVQIFNLGLAERPGTARITPDGSASTIGEQGTETIQLARLDDCIQERTSFLKLDIEGAEAGALAGAAGTIAKDSPKIAVAVYHHASDLWRIPRQILAINSDYELRLRHYTEGVVETVMFFLPKNRH